MAPTVVSNLPSSCRVCVWHYWQDGAALDGGRGRGATAARCGRLADPADAGGRLWPLVRRYPAACVSPAGDSAPSVGPGTAGGAGADRDSVPVLRRRVPLARQCALLRRRVPDPCRGAVSWLRAAGRASAAVLVLCAGREAVRLALTWRRVRLTWRPTLPRAAIRRPSPYPSDPLRPCPVCGCSVPSQLFIFI